MPDPRQLFYDTCFYIDVLRGHVPESTTSELVSPCLIVGHAIVMMELQQGAWRNSDKRFIRTLQNSLTWLAPSLQNYLEAGPILQNMAEKGWLSKNRLYELQNDVLLALSAAENNSWLVTRNRKDFEKIRRLCPVAVLYY